MGRSHRSSRLTLGLVAAAMVLASSRSAGADELPPEPRATRSFLVGAGLATASFGGGLMLTGNSGDGNVQNAGIIIAQSGLTLAPLAAHAVAGEWKRGVVFSLPPLAAELGMLLLVDRWGDRLVTQAPLGTQYLYSSLFTASVLFSALGVVDSLFADDRSAEARAESARGGAAPWIAPSFDRNGCGIRLGGVL